MTEESAQEHILDFLRDYPGKCVSQWDMLNKICVFGNRRENRACRKFYLRQVGELVRLRKVIRYRAGMLRGTIRISEAYV